MQEIFNKKLFRCIVKNAEGNVVTTALFVGDLVTTADGQQDLALMLSVQPAKPILEKLEETFGKENLFWEKMQEEAVPDITPEPAVAEVAPSSEVVL